MSKNTELSGRRREGGQQAGQGRTLGVPVLTEEEFDKLIGR